MGYSRKYFALGLVAAVTASSLVYLLLFGRSAVVPDSQLQEIIFVDFETGEAFLILARSSREVNPHTGKQTLVPGMYCKECKAWKAVGPMEILQKKRLARICPIHKTPLLQDGPLPDEK